MKPLEAYAVISQCIDELHNMRKTLYPTGKAYSDMELKAQVIAFEALRRMEEEHDNT